MNPRALLLFAHLVGVVLWLGLSFTLSFVTARAARQEEPAVAAFAYLSAARLLRTLGTAGVILTVGSGLGLVTVTDYELFRPFPNHWLFQMQLLGLAAGAIALFYQIPLAARLARAAEEWVRTGTRPDGFGKLRRRSAMVGSLVGFLLIVLVGLGAFRLP